MTEFNSGWLISGLADSLDSQLLEEIIATFREQMGLSSNCYASLVVCSADQMRSLNLRYRGTDATTDVLSFPADRESGIFREDESGSIYLGEILVDINYILSQSNSTDINKEIIPVLVHGLLHLLGFDHLSSSQQIKMRELENKIIAKIRTV